MGQSFFLIGGEEGLGAGKRDFFFLTQAGDGAWPVGLNRDGDRGEVSTVQFSSVQSLSRVRLFATP